MNTAIFDSNNTMLLDDNTNDSTSSNQHDFTSSHNHRVYHEEVQEPSANSEIKTNSFVTDSIAWIVMIIIVCLIVYIVYHLND